MKKLLSILLILFTAFVASAQTDGTSTISVVAPISGLGSLADKENVIMGSTSTFTLDLTSGGLGGISLRTLVKGGKVISMKQGTNSYTLADISAGLNVKHYYTPLLSALDPITIEVQWETLGEGYLAFRQEAELACFNDTYSIYYIQVNAGYTVEFGDSDASVCAGSEFIQNIVFGELDSMDDTAVMTINYKLSTSSTTEEFTLNKTKLKADNSYDIIIPIPKAYFSSELTIKIESATVLINGNNIGIDIKDETKTVIVNPLPDTSEISIN